jgi:hypothetical protein
MATSASNAPLIQGNALTPDVTVDPNSFYANTRRLRYPMVSKTKITGIGSSDSVSLRQSGIVAALEVRISGTVTLNGTYAATTMTYEWPYNFVKAFTLSANGQSTLINARGLIVRAQEFASNNDINDRGVSHQFGGTSAAFTQTQGTLALSVDDWGTNAGGILAPGTVTTVAAGQVFTVDITYFIPVAADQVSLIGSVYAQSSATNLTLGLQYAASTDLISLGAGVTVDFSNLTYDVTGVVYSIPNVNGKYVIPDLTQFHSLTEALAPTPAAGLNEPQLPGVGAGRKLLRTFFNVYSGAFPGTPYVINDTNYNTVGWAYGGNTVPESYAFGQKLRALNERQTGVDLGRNWGIGMWDFASQFALRDVVDEGSTANLRLQIGLVNNPTTGRLPVAQENLFSGVVGA